MFPAEFDESADPWTSTGSDPWASTMATRFKIDNRARVDVRRFFEEVESGELATPADEAAAAETPSGSRSGLPEVVSISTPSPTTAKLKAWRRRRDVAT